MTATTPPGRVLRDRDGVRLEFRRTLDQAVDDVWSALTDPERTARWFGAWSGDPATGSVEVVLSDEDGAPSETMRIDACEPPHRLAVTAGTADGPWPLEVVLTEDGGRTALRFVHRLAEPYDASAVGPGWHYYLDRLTAVVAGTPAPDAFEEYHPALAGAYPVPAAP